MALRGKSFQPAGRYLPGGLVDVKGDRVMLVLSTVPGKESARIAEVMVNERLVACVNATPVKSTYRWKGEICRDREELLVMKTKESLFPDVMKRLREIHPCEVPEILAVPVWGGFPGYLDWVMEETGRGSGWEPDRRPSNQ